MSEQRLLVEIVEALEEQGLDQDGYQLQRVIDVDALEQLANSADSDTELEIRFTVGEFCVLVTDSEVTIFV
ncbi:HalOD1 output domain-containing protein [Natrarchaeobius chitinivorans]|uniref:Halobacterial output domain-containing protein n=1 Tax=Natrarchaeobius chitinivorans TaxID=1679083 RepID=A0A3N6LR91_NATCH|nr:HalOD1 output domain-containing protein [Natrarchaeobius chitinivorans]RQG90877.1 hypothetical protein EA473_19985 [Natrarchaeobius chitinivorans]